MTAPAKKARRRARRASASATRAAKPPAGRGSATRSATTVGPGAKAVTAGARTPSKVSANEGARARAKAGCQDECDDECEGECESECEGSRKTRGETEADATHVKVFHGPALVHQAGEVLRRLRVTYPDARTELNFNGPFQLLVVTILSAQTTDVRVNMVSPALFARYPTAEALATADPAELEQIIRSTGFFHAKAKSLIGMAKALVERHRGAVPASMAGVVTLPGVGRKTANVVLGNAFGRNEGVVVDTHVGRLSLRLGLTDDTDPVKVEQTLMTCVPQNDWTLFSHLLIFHGRRVCAARSPACARCVLSDTARPPSRSSLFLFALVHSLLSTFYLLLAVVAVVHFPLSTS